MWRNYVISVLIGLLLVSSGSSLFLLRQSMTLQAATDRLQQRAASAEATQTSLRQQLAAAPTPAPTLESVTSRAQAIAPLPTATAQAADASALQQIENAVITLRGLQPKTTVPVRFLDQATLQRMYLDRFNQDYSSSERESDQKLLSTLGIIGPNESVATILLDVLQEQILGVYNSDDKVMYLLASSGQFGPDEKDTFAQEFDHALQDQYYDLNALAPKHPDNDDRSLAIQALTEGDATLIQRLWAQQNLTSAEINQLGQSGGTSKLLSAPLFLREQLLFPYGDGFNFVRQIYQTSGYAGVDAVYRDPPQSTSQILHIDKYRNHVAPVEVDLPDLSQGALGDGWRKINSNVLGELDLRLILTQLTDSTHGVQGSNGWAGDRWELVEKDGRDALVIKSIWDNDTSAASFFDTFSMAMKNRYFGATVDEDSESRNALSTPAAATDVRRYGTTVVAVIAPSRDTANAIADAVSP